MTEKCFDIGIIQGFLDGELGSEMTETIARHISICDDCAILMAAAEEETAFAFSVLEQEFNTLVPTQRLWTKINETIEREKKSFWQPIFAFLLQPSTAAFASLLFVAVVSITLLSLKSGAPPNSVELANVNEQKIISQPIFENQPSPLIQTPTVFNEKENIKVTNDKQNKPEVRAIKTGYVKPEINRTAVNTTDRNVNAVIPADKNAVAASSEQQENVLGEESYIKTIATLSATVNNRKDEVLDPSARFAYERDLAVTDNAIKQMRKEVRKNPKNEAAKQILRTSYQNKIDLLNSVADKTELMASLR
jgi:hypothetical protein